MDRNLQNFVCNLSRYDKLNSFEGARFIEPDLDGFCARCWRYRAEGEMGKISAHEFTV